MERTMYKSFQAIGREYWGEDFDATDIVTSLDKALSSGGLVNPVNADSTSAGAALRLENLDATMTSVLIDNNDFVIFNWLERVPTTQALYQWNRRLRYGTGRGMLGFPEGGAPVGSSAQFERDLANVKFLGVRRGVTQQFALMGDRGGTTLDPVSEENRDGTMELMEKVERNLVWADKTIHDETQTEVNYDGIVRQMEKSKFAATHIVDVRDNMTLGRFDDMTEVLRTDGKLRNMDDMQAFMTPNTMKTLAEEIKANGRFMAQQNLGANGQRSNYGDVGIQTMGHLTQFGWIPFEHSILLERVDSSHPVNAFQTAGDVLAPAAPGAPTVTPQTLNTGGVSQLTTSYFSTGQTSYYYVAAFNSYGESLGVYSGAGATISTGQEVSISIPATTGAIGYRIYRNDDSNDVTKAGIIGSIAAVNGSATVFFDVNSYLPNTDICLVLNRNPETLAMAQLAPLIKWPLAVTSTTVEFLLLLYHTIVVKASERIFIFKNIKRLTAS